MPDPAPDVLDAASQVIVLAFDLVDATLPDAPELLEKALKSKQVEQAITKTLLDYAKSKGKIGAKPATTEEGQKLLAALGTGITDAGRADVLSQIRKSAEVQEARSVNHGVQANRRIVAARVYGSIETRRSCTSSAPGWW